MIFGALPLDQAEGAILAHAVKAEGIAFKKGRRLSADDLNQLASAGVTEVTVAKLGTDDIHEDTAAARIAEAAAGPVVSCGPAFTGRVNLFADAAGVFVADKLGIDRLNGIDEAVTIATLPHLAAVQAGQMVATVKIIPFAVARPVMDLVSAVLTASGPLLRVAEFQPLRIALIQTQLPGTATKVLDKTTQVTERRVTSVGGKLVAERRCAHDAPALVRTLSAMLDHGAQMILIAGASAITDRHDVLPAAIEQAGGDVEHFGMPVDPGNLLLTARIGDVPVLGLPGCARSPKLNGFDWVLQRQVAGLPIGRDEIMGLGVGGLLTEIPTRPQPRSGTPEEPAATAADGRPRIAAIVLAAGQSRRMGATNKLTAPVDGKPMVAHAVDAALASSVANVVVVTGHQAAEVRAAIGDRPVDFVENPDFAEGLSASLKVGVAVLPEGVDGAVVCLGDMPRVTGADLDRLIGAFNPLEGRAIVVPTWNGKRGNPVLWDSRFFPAMGDLSGDVGAKHLIGENEEVVAEVPMDQAGVLLDVDTPDALARLETAD